MMPSITQLASASDGSSGSRRRLHSAFVAAGRGRRRLQPESQLQRQEAEFVLVEASVRSGSGSGVELTPEVDDIRRQRLHQHHSGDDNLGEGLVLTELLICVISLKGNYMGLSPSP